MFGPDGPIVEPYISNQQWIEMIRGLLQSDDGLTFTAGEIDAILGKNAAKVFDL
jgi:predicted TIM-barrel fold metal-dependent hydrolase